MYLFTQAICVSAVEAFAQIHLKKGNLGSGVAGYTGVAYLLYETYKSQNLSSFNTTWSAVSILNAALLGALVFGERICMRTVFSMVLVVVAIYIA
jgi:multidrug transporter EmrE-like cation transporter